MQRYVGPGESLKTQQHRFPKSGAHVIDHRIESRLPRAIPHALLFGTWYIATINDVLEQGSRERASTINEALMSHCLVKDVQHEELLHVDRHFQVV